MCAVWECAVGASGQKMTSTKVCEDRELGRVEKNRPASAVERTSQVHSSLAWGGRELRE